MDAGASAVQVNSRSGGVSKTVGPTQDEWEAHRATISALYGEETLSRVRDIMKRDHGFEASERMYKTRVKHWRLDKKAKADEMLQALEMIEKRKAEGKPSCVVIRERTISEAEVRKYFKRQKISTSRAIPRRKTSTDRAPTTIICFTPPSTASPGPTEDGTTLLMDNSSIIDRRANVSADATHLVSSPSMRSKLLPKLVSPSARQNTMLQARPSGRPKTYTGFPSGHGSLFLMSPGPCDPVPLPTMNLPSLDEKALMEIRDYYNTYCHSTSWKLWVDARLQWAHYPGEFSVDRPSTSPFTELEDPARLVGIFQVATRLYGTHSAYEAYSMKNAAFEKLGQLIREQHPQLLSCFLLLICVLDSSGFPELSSEVLFYTHDMAHVKLGSAHHITRLTSLLARSVDRDALVERALQCIQDLYQQRAGQLHPSYLDAAYNHAWSHFQRGRLHDAKREFRQLHDLYESYAQFDGLRPRKVLYGIAQVEIAQGSLDTADSLLAEAQRRTCRRFGTTTRVDIWFECLRLRAALRQRPGPDMYSMISEALEEAQLVLGSTHPTVMLLKHTIQTISLL